MRRPLATGLQAMESASRMSLPRIRCSARFLRRALKLQHARVGLIHRRWFGCLSRRPRRRRNFDERTVASCSDHPHSDLPFVVKVSTFQSPLENACALDFQLVALQAFVSMSLAERTVRVVNLFIKWVITALRLPRAPHTIISRRNFSLKSGNKLHF
jgi:hypothetical protein